MHRVRGRVRAGAGDDRGLVADRLERGADQVEPLAVRRASGSRRSCPATTTPSEPFSTRWRASALERVEVDAAVLVERRHHRRQDAPEHAGIVRVRASAQATQRSYEPASLRDVLDALCRRPRRAEGTRPRTAGRRARRAPPARARAAARAPARRCAARRARRRRARGRTARPTARASRAPRRAAASPFRAAFSRSSSIASAAQSVAVTRAPRAAATSDGTPSPQPSSTTRDAAHVRAAPRRARARPATARPSTAGTRRRRTPLRRSAPRATTGRSSSSRTSRDRDASSEKSVKPDGEARRQRRQLLEREQDARRVRLARDRVVADRERLARRRRGSPPGGRSSPGSRTEWIGTSPPMRSAVSFAVPDGASSFVAWCSSTISARVEIARRLGGEAHHQHRAEREVRRVEDRHAGASRNSLGVPAASCRRRTARRRRPRRARSRRPRPGRVKSTIASASLERVDERVARGLEARPEHRADLAAAAR